MAEQTQALLTNLLLLALGAHAQPFLIHEEGVITYVNDPFLTLFDLTAAEAIIGTHVTKYIAPHDRVRVHGYGEARRLGRHAPTTYPLDVLRQDGTSMPITVTLISSKDEKGTRRTIVLIETTFPTQVAMVATAVARDVMEERTTTIETSIADKASTFLYRLELLERHIARLEAKMTNGFSSDILLLKQGVHLATEWRKDINQRFWTILVGIALLVASVLVGWLYKK